MALFDRSKLHEMTLEDPDIPILADAIELFTEDLILVYAQLRGLKDPRPAFNTIENATKTTSDFVLEMFKVDEDMVDQVGAIATGLTYGAVSLRAYLELARSHALAGAEGAHNGTVLETGNGSSHGESLEPGAGPGRGAGEGSSEPEQPDGPGSPGEPGDEGVERGAGEPGGGLTEEGIPAGEAEPEFDGGGLGSYEDGTEGAPTAGWSDEEVVDPELEGEPDERV